LGSVTERTRFQFSGSFSRTQSSGQSEIGKRRIAGQLNQPFGADPFVQCPALLLSAHVTPDQRRAHHFSRGIQHHGAMHLPRKSYAGDLIASQVSLRQRFADGDAGGTPPILWTLLSPSDFRRGERFVLFGSRRGDTSFFIDDQRPRAAGANIDSST
jgi:hypothetical protein